MRPGEGETVATWYDGEVIPRYASTSPRAGVTGDIEALALWAGQSVGLIDDVRPAGDIVRELAAEAAAELRRGAGLVRT
jgi:nitronate monooxygenase